MAVAIRMLFSASCTVIKLYFSINATNKLNMDFIAITEKNGRVVLYAKGEEGCKSILIPMNGFRLVSPSTEPKKRIWLNTEKSEGYLFMFGTVEEADRLGYCLDATSGFSAHCSVVKLYLSINASDELNVDEITVLRRDGRLKLSAKGIAGRKDLLLPIEGFRLVRPSTESRKCIWLNTEKSEGYLFMFETAEEANCFALRLPQ